MARKPRSIFIRLLLGLALVLAIIIVFFFIGYLIGTRLAIVGLPI